MNNDWRKNREPGWASDIGYKLQDELNEHDYQLSKPGSKPESPGWHPCKCGQWQGYWPSFHPHVADRLRELVEAELATVKAELAEAKEQLAQANAEWSYWANR